MKPSAIPPETAQDAVARQHRALLSLVQLDKSDLDTSLRRILQAASEALRVERVSFWRLDEERTRLVCLRRYHLSSDTFSQEEVVQLRDLPLYVKSLVMDREIRVDDTSRHPLTSELAAYFSEHGITSMLDIPVWHRGATVGVLCHEHVGPPRVWLESERDFALSVAGMVSVGLEAHERHQAETRYQLLTDALRDLVWDWDLRTDEIAWNSAAVTSLGFASKDVAPNLEWWKRNVHPDDLERVMAGLTRHAESGQGVWRDEYRFRRGDGAWAMMVDRGVLQRDAEGKPLRMVGAMVDVTEQRQLEARVALSDRMASVGTLAAGVAHEINNPLMYIHGNLSYALRALSENPGAPAQQSQTEALIEALSGVERVQRIVQDLKAFSRPEEHPERVELRSAVAAALSLARNEIRHRAQLVEEHQPIPPVLANPARLGQVALNLLVNAAQAIPDGKAEEHQITVRTCAATNGRVRLEVEDTGVGLPAELLTRIFDPFFSTKPVGEGTGLGLTISHAIVSSLGGSLTLENKESGRGAIARVELPAAEALVPGPGEPAFPVVPLASPPRRARVLIIDDTPNICLSMQRLLSDQHEVETTGRAREALEALAAGRRWDVIFCDLMMPELNGMELVAQVERLDPSVLRRIVIMSGGAFSPQTQEFLRRWPHAQLEKPIRPERLAAEILRLLEATEAESPELFS